MFHKSEGGRQKKERREREGEGVEREGDNSVKNEKVNEGV
jgi:hypothetical protein